VVVHSVVNSNDALHNSVPLVVVVIITQHPAAAPNYTVQ
jgi:hypothetical protein